MDQRDLYHQGLDSLSPLDGREILHTAPLRRYFSEGALHGYRARVEVENLIAITDALPNAPKLNDTGKEDLRFLVRPENFDPRTTADYDHFGRDGKGPFEHDVKAVETHLRELFDDNLFHAWNEYIHFPATSEDINNLAYGMMIRDGLNDVWLPKVLEVCDSLALLAEKHADTPVLGRTHGPPASPTTVGKRFGYALDKIGGSLEPLRTMKLDAKFSGPVGNHNAMTAVAPDFDMRGYARSFVESLGFEYADAENQRISHRSIVRALNGVQEANVYGADLCENVRHGVMLGHLYQESTETHVGSSVMPHKVNPWFFEVGQGHFEISNTLIDGARAGLQSTVFERDLTDHPWERMYGTMVGHSLVGFSYVADGLKTLRVDAQKCREELAMHPEVLSEAIQIAGRALGVSDVYMKIKEKTRGKNVSLADLRQIMRDVLPESPERERLLALTPETYIGQAPRIARSAVGNYKSTRYRTQQSGILRGG